MPFCRKNYGLIDVVCPYPSQTFLSLVLMKFLSLIHALAVSFSEFIVYCVIYDL